MSHTNGKLTPNMVDLWDLPAGVTAKVEHFRNRDDCALAGLRVKTQFALEVPHYATHVTLYRPDIAEPIGEGWSFCSPYDTDPSRRVGHAIARNRALKDAAHRGYLWRMDKVTFICILTTEHSTTGGDARGMYVNTNP